jgi:riboflavin kinase / FMN adenylyltransferase
MDGKTMTTDPRTESTVVLGEFDGFHRGHHRLVSAARDLAERSGQPLIAVILDYAAREQRLLQPVARARHALELGAGSAHVLAVPDRCVSDITDLVVEKVHEITSPTQVVMACSPLMSPNSGWYPSMASVFDKRDTTVVQVPRVWGRVGEVSSRAVIHTLNDGDVGVTAEMLGRRSGLGGVVVRGAGLGHTLGFATANLVPPERLVIPKEGVYAAVVTHDGRRYMAAVNIGRRPTVESHGGLLVEAHLLDFDDDLYGQHLELEFHSRLRSEQRFDGLDHLVAQLAKDVDAVRAKFPRGLDPTATLRSL